MRAIDIHTHVFPNELAARAIGSLVDHGGLRPHYDGTVSGLLRCMDETGVSISVIQPVATRASQVTGINDWVASIASERIYVFGSMHPAFTEPANEIARMVELGIRGIKLHPEFQDFDPLDRRMATIYEAAADAGLPILFHAGADPAFESVRGVPSAFRELASRHPDLVMILAHLGGFGVWEEVCEHLCGENVFLDTSSTLEHLPAGQVAEIITSHGTDRILFGSDGPWADAGKELALLSEIGLAEEELDAILWRNAAELLSVEEPPAADASEPGGARG